MGPLPGIIGFFVKGKFKDRHTQGRIPWGDGGERGDSSTCQGISRILFLLGEVDSKQVHKEINKLFRLN